MAPYFIKLQETSDAVDLMQDMPAFMLLTLIAFRANKERRGVNLRGLAYAECQIGDHEVIGLSEQQYRSAKSRLAAHGLATFKPTTKGTIAKILDKRVYDISRSYDNEQANDVPTDEQRTGNGPATTNQDLRSKKEEREEEPDPLLFFRELIRTDEFRVLDKPEIHDVLTSWVRFRAEIKKPASPRSVRIDAGRMVQVLDAGGDAAVIGDWMDRAMTADPPWQGWFFRESFERWKKNRAAGSTDEAVRDLHLGKTDSGIDSKLFHVMNGGLAQQTG